jgi:hypothetical protein
MKFFDNVKKRIFKGVKNEKLKSLIASTYRYNSKMNRTIADAIRYEKRSGDFIGRNLSTDTLDGVVSEDAILPFMLEECPSFQSVLEEIYTDWGDDDRSLSMDLTDLAGHLVNLIKEDKVDEFIGVFGTVENLISLGNEKVIRFIAISFLEDLQNMSGNNGIDPESFSDWLLPNTRVWWDEINRFWHDLEIFLEIEDTK